MNQLVEHRSEELKARSNEERRVLLLGYAMAINDINDHGISFARETLAFLLGDEYPITIKEEVPYG